MTSTDYTQEVEYPLPHKIVQALRFCPTLPTLPGVAIKLLDVSKNPNIDINTLVNILDKDPALATKLLKTSRSPLYGNVGSKISNLNDAIKVLGLHATITIALTFGVSSSYKPKDNNSIHLQILRRSLLAGLAARCLGKEVGRTDYDELFLAGILQDVGILALKATFPEEYDVVWTRAHDHEMLICIEYEVLGCNHMQAGAWLMSHWRLPGFVIDAVAASQLPDSNPPSEADVEFTRCIALSGCMADLFRPVAFSVDSKLTIDTHMTNISDKALNWCGLSASNLENVLVNISSMIPEIESLFEEQLVSENQAEGIMNEAREILMIKNLQQTNK